MATYFIREDDAKQKWCRYALVLDHKYSTQGGLLVGAAVNRSGNLDCNCIGSNCMSWQPDATTERDDSKVPMGRCGELNG